LGIEARSRALLGTGQPAEKRIPGGDRDRLGRTRIRAELARAHLCTGNGCAASVAASTHGTAAHRTRHVHLNGRRGVHQRGGPGVAAPVEITRHSAAWTDSELTSQEAHIARLVREGLSNPEIAARLFISTQV